MLMFKKDFIMAKLMMDVIDSYLPPQESFVHKEFSLFYPA